jgi:hypothetical protein
LLVLLTMKRKLDKRKLVLDQNTVTILTTDQFESVRGGGATNHCEGECAGQNIPGRDLLTGRRC